MFVHVPCAWLSMFIYALIAVSSFGLLVFRHPLADVSAKAAAPLGAYFTFLCAADGRPWGSRCGRVSRVLETAADLGVRSWSSSIPA